MVPRVCVISIGITSANIAKALSNMDLPAQFILKDMLLHDAAELPGDLDSFDVLLSSGNNAQVLRRCTDKPVITISPSLYDILLACSKALDYCDKPVIYMYQNTFSTVDIKQVANVLAVDIEFETYERTDASIEERIVRYKQEGLSCIIGSGMVCEIAERHGIRSIYLFPEESIRNSLHTAADLAVSIFQNNQNNLHLSTVVNSSARGIILVNPEGEIFLCNPRAKKYLGIREQFANGLRIEQFFDSEAVQRIAEATAATRLFREFQGVAYAVEVLPIVTRGEVTDRLLYIEDLHEIQKTEREFRREIWAQKGFVAKYSFKEYHTVNRQFQDFLSIAKSFAKTEEPVVILGETGVGKEFLAQSIHNHSTRSGKAFVAVNCAAIPENLLESELFGYSDGAFTGAKKGGKEGYFEMAHMGTIFLDEIGEMNILLQSKLLRVIQERQVLRVGATQLVPFDARIIVATNKNLWQLVQDGTFRKDLYYRLNVLELDIPPLRQRPDDTLVLFEDFLCRLSPAIWGNIASRSEDLLALLSSHTWPGNVRELENFVHMMVAHWRPSDGQAEIMDMVRRLLALKQQRNDTGDSGYPPPLPTPPPHRSDTGLLKANEERQIREAMKACDNNFSRAAEMLGIHRTTLWRKLKRFGIDDR